MKLLIVLLACGYGWAVISVWAQTPDSVPPANMLLAPVVTETGDGRVGLLWEPLQDDVGTVAYKVYSSEYSFLGGSMPNPDPPMQFSRYKRVDGLQTVIEGLVNGTKYYFTVTGVDAAGNESEYIATETMTVPSAAQSADGLARCASDDECGSGAFCYWITDGPHGPGDLGGGPAGDGFCHQRCLREGEDCGNGGKCMEIGRQCSGDVCAAKEIFCSSVLPDEGRPSPAASPSAAASVTPLPTSSPVPVSIPSLTSPPLPVLPPKISNLQATFERVVDRYDVSLSWSLPEGVERIIAQVLYQSLNGAQFGELVVLAPSVASHVVAHLDPGQYTFKVTTRNTDGVEGQGVTMLVDLPPTGPALIGLALLSVGTALTIARRPRNEGNDADQEE